MDGSRSGAAIALCALLAVLSAGAANALPARPAAQAVSKIEIPFRTLKISRGCFPFALYVAIEQAGGAGARENPRIPRTFVINSEGQYQKLLRYRRHSCAGARLPAVDFRHQTLLANYDEGTCATTGFAKKVVRDNAARTYTYSVKAETDPARACMGPGLQDMNWILIPKIPRGFSVRFSATQ